jgi:hypothetical protein
MTNNDYTLHERGVRIRLDATASRPPGRRTGWTVEAGYWRADAATEKAAVDALAERLRVFLTQYQPARVLSFRGCTAVVEIDLGDDHNSATWRRRIVGPDGSVGWAVFGAANWDEAEAQVRHDLAQRSTDWHDDDSVHEAAAYLECGPSRADDRCGPDELYRYAAWQRAARRAMQAGREDWHEWASAHEREFAIPRRTGKTG